jgi:ABC-type sugar transport system substrate-binding protein
MALAGVVGLFGVAVVMGGLLASGAGAAGSKVAAQPLVIGYTDPDGAEQGLQSVGYGAQQAIKELHLPWTLKALDDKLSANQQVSDIDTLITLHAAAIMSWTLDPGAAAAAYERAKAAGIPVVGLDSQSKTFTSAIGDYADATCIVSNQQAAYIAKLVPHATVLAIGGPPVPSITLTRTASSRQQRRPVSRSWICRTTPPERPTVVSRWPRAC